MHCLLLVLAAGGAAASTTTALASLRLVTFCTGMIIIELATTAAVQVPIFQGCVRYGTGILGTGIDVVPYLPKCAVPVLTSYRTYRIVRHRYWRYTELTEVSGTGIDVVPNLPKFPVPVLISYRTYRSFRCRY